MNMIFKSPIQIIILLLFGSSLIGQEGYELGGSIGITQYFGDLNTKIVPNRLGPVLSLNARYNFDTRIALKSSLSLARIGANDDNSSNNFERLRNLDFHSNIVDMTILGEFNFYKYEHGSKDFTYTPYLAAGFSIFYHNPTSLLQGEKYSLRKLGTEGQGIGEEYNAISGAFTLGGGVKWDINRDWSLNFELTIRKLFTDYLDDVSTVFTDKQSLAARRGPEAAALSDRSLDDAIGLAGRQRGNSKSNDTYVFLSIGIMKYFGDIKCPPISRIR